MSLSIMLLKAMTKKSGVALTHEAWDVEQLRENAAQTGKMPAQKGVSFEVKEYDGVRM